MARDKQFDIPNTGQAHEYNTEPPAVQRHYILLHQAMLEHDKMTVGNRQLRLLGGGYEVPITAKQCKALLERY